MKKRILSVLALAMALLLILTACGGGTADTGTTPPAEKPTDATTEPAKETPASLGEPVTISLWGGWTGPDADAMKAITEAYTAENPNVIIEFETQQWTPLFTKFFAEASEGNAPDILAVHPVDIGQFAEFGLLDTEMASTFGLNAADYSQTAWDGTFIDGVQYAVPIDLHMHGLYYNKDLFEAAGITEAPATGDGLIEAAKLLTVDVNGKNATEDGFDKDNIEVYGLGFHQHHHIIFQLTALLAQQGEVAFTEDMTEVPFSKEAAAKAFKWLQDFAYIHNTTPIGEASPPDDFKAGKVAMLIDGPWQMSGLTETSLNWGTAPYPQVFENKSVWGSGHSFAFSVNNSTDAEKEAVKGFVTWLSANSEIWAQSGQIPASNTGKAFAQTLPNRQAFVDSLDNVVLFPPHPMSSDIFANSQGSPFINAAEALMLEGADPDAVAEKFIAEMNATLANK